MDDIERLERHTRSHWRCSACGQMHPLSANVCEPCMDKALAEDQKKLDVLMEADNQAADWLDHIYKNVRR